LRIENQILIIKYNSSIMCKANDLLHQQNRSRFQWKPVNFFHFQFKIDNNVMQFFKKRLSKRWEVDYFCQQTNFMLM
ncbi:hypothetical protein T4A_7070, partial [Trichinella pseudospiralis]